MLCRNVADISGEDKGKRIDVGTLHIVLSVMKCFYR